MPPGQFPTNDTNCVHQTIEQRSHRVSFSSKKNNIVKVINSQ